MRLALLVSLFLFYCLQVGRSCSCFTKSYRIDVLDSEIIFVGTPVGKNMYFGDTSLFLTIEYQFEIDEILKGADASERSKITLYSTDFEGGCGSAIILNQQHLVFAEIDSAGRYFSYCWNNTAAVKKEKSMFLSYIRFLISTGGFIDIWRLLLVFGVIGIVFLIKIRRKRKSQQRTLGKTE